MPTARTDKARRPRGRIAVAIAVAAVLWSTAAAADDDGPLFVSIVVADDRDRALLDRVEGQTSDLPLALVPHAVTPASTGPAQAPTERLATAGKIADDAGTRVVVWFEHKHDALVIYVAEPAAQTLLVRSVARRPGGDRVRTSADLEAAALIVRSSLQAIALGARVGQPEPALAKPAAPSPPPREPGPARVPVAVEREPLRWHAGLGGRAVFDSALPAQLGGQLTVGATRGSLRVDATADLSPATELAETSPATIDLARYGVRAVVGWAPNRFERRLLLEASAGAVWFRRSTRQVTAGFTATDDATVGTGLVGFGARYSVPVGPAFLELAASADALLPAPEFGVSADAMFQAQTRFWPVQPRVSFGVFTKF